MPKKVCFSADKFFHSETALVHVAVHDLQVVYIHTSWMLENGVIVAFEYSSDEYPQATLVFFPNAKEYLRSIKNVFWIWGNLPEEKKEELMLLAEQS